MYAQPSVGPVLQPAAVEKLVENGKKLYGWRCIDGVPRYCVVGLVFTMVPDAGQEKDKAGFERAMEGFCGVLSRSGYPVVGWFVEQRAGGRPWAAFRCRTPQYRLPRPREDAACAELEAELLPD